VFLNLRRHLLGGGRKRAGGVHGWVRGLPKSMNATIWAYKMSKRQILFQWSAATVVEACVFVALAISGLLARMSATDIMIVAFLPLDAICLRRAISNLPTLKEGIAKASAARKNVTVRQIIWRVALAVSAASAFLAVAISGVLDRLPTVLLIAVGLANPVIIELIQSGRDIRSEIKRGRD
jgi:hypothetical protein